MKHLNYNHLLYFWTVAREGSIVKASKVLHLTPQTISGQLKLLEDSVGDALFNRLGRGLVLTEKGHVVVEYAEEIFSLGSELAQQIQNNQPNRQVALNVGIVNSIPKLIAHQILAPALEMALPPKLVCYENDMESLLGQLAIHRLDLVISDRAIQPGLNVKAFNHALGNSSVSFFGCRALAKKYKSKFPGSLDQAPVLLPHRETPLRRILDDWFEQVSITPNIIAEFEDSALMKAFGEAGQGLFPAPTKIASEIEYMYRATEIGQLSALKETYYAISPERKLRHPAILEITAAARSSLFA